MIFLLLLLECISGCFCLKDLKRRCFHFRGTNKIGGGAEAHPIEEYMEQVELWFRKYEVLHEPVRRRIFLATDEPQVYKIRYEDPDNV